MRVGALCALAPAVGAQSAAAPPESFLARATFGLLTAPADAALRGDTAGQVAAFLDLPAALLMTGLANPLARAATSSNSDPFWAALAAPGREGPWAVLVEGLMSTAAAGVDNDSALSGPVVETAGSTDYLWYALETETRYDWLQDTDIDVGLRILAGRRDAAGGAPSAGLGSGGLVYGGRVAVRSTQNVTDLAPFTWAVANRTVTERVAYNAATASVRPDVRTDYTVITRFSSPDSSLLATAEGNVASTGWRAPVAASVRYTFERRDRSDGVAVSLPSSTAFGVLSWQAAVDGPLTDTVTDVDVRHGIDLLAQVNIPTRVGAASESGWLIGLEAAQTFGTPQLRETRLLEEDRTVTSAGSSTPALVTDRITSQQRRGVTALRYQAEAQWRARFGAAGEALVTAVGPKVGLAVQRTPADTVRTVRSVETERFDLDGDGTVSGAADRVIVTSTEYFGNADGHPLAVELTAGLDSALVARLGALPLRIVLGSELGFRLTYVRTADGADYTVITADTDSGDGADVSDVVTRPATVPGAIVVEYELDAVFWSNYELMLELDLAGRVTAAVLMGAALNALDLQNLAWQLVVSVPL